MQGTLAPQHRGRRHGLLPFLLHGDAPLPVLIELESKLELEKATRPSPPVPEEQAAAEEVGEAARASTREEQGGPRPRGRCRVKISYTALVKIS